MAGHLREMEGGTPSGSSPHLHHLRGAPLHPAPREWLCNCIRARCTHWCPTACSGLFQSCAEFHQTDTLQPVHRGHLSCPQRRGSWVTLL